MPLNSTAYLTDTFNRANTSPATGANSTTGVGNGWIDRVGGVYSINSDLLTTTSIYAGYMLDWLVRPTSENSLYQRIVGQFSANSQAIPILLLRVNSASDNAYAAYYDYTGTITIATFLNGSSTHLQTGSFSWSASNNYILDFTAVPNATAGTDLTLKIYNAAAPTTLLNQLIVTGDTTAALQSAGTYGISNSSDAGQVTSSSISLYTGSSSPSLSVSPATAVLSSASSTQSLTATLSGSTASLSAAVSGGGTLSTTSPISGTPFTYTSPSSGSGTATVTITDSTDGLTSTSTISYSPAPAPGLSETPTTATVSGPSATVSITATRTNSSASLTASVSGGGTLSTSSPTSGTPFTYTAPATGSGTATVTVTDATDGLTSTTTITYNAAATGISISPSTFPLGVATPFTMTGTGTSWTGSTKPTVSGGTNAYFSNVVISGQTITGTLLPGSVSGTLTIGDSTDSYTTTATAAANITTNVVWHGDSLTYGQNGTGAGTTSATRLAQVLSGLGPTAQGTNLGVGGQQISSMISEIPGTVTPLWQAGMTNYLVVQGGHNDIGGGGQNAAAVISRIQTYISTVLAAHPWKIIWCTELPAAYPSVYPAQFDSIRDTVNAYMRANWKSLGIYALSDVASNAQIGPDGSEYNSTFYSGSDFTHLTDAGYTIWGRYDLAAIQAPQAPATTSGRSFSFF